MTNDSNYELSSTDDLDFDNDEPTNELDSNIAEFELDTSATDSRKSKNSNKRNFLAKKKIEQLQEERRLRKLDDDYYDDWD